MKLIVYNKDPLVQAKEYEVSSAKNYIDSFYVICPYKVANQIIKDNPASIMLKNGERFINEDVSYECVELILPDDYHIKTIGG